MDHVWALDFQFDKTVNGRATGVPNIMTGYARESLAIVVDHSINADDTVTALAKTLIECGRAPAFVRCDNGPEIIAYAFADWCKPFCAGTH